MPASAGLGSNDRAVRSRLRLGAVDEGRTGLDHESQTSVNRRISLMVVEQGSGTGVCILGGDLSESMQKRPATDVDTESASWGIPM